MQLKGYWKLVDPSLSISPTFGEIGQHFRKFDDVQRTAFKAPQGTLEGLLGGV
jgi:hypothetical protein